MKHWKEIIVVMSLCANYANAFVECRGGQAYNCSYMVCGGKSCTRWPAWDHMCQPQTSEREYLKNDRMGFLHKSEGELEFENFLNDLERNLDKEEWNEKVDNLIKDEFNQYKKDLINKYGGLDNIPLDEYAKLRLNEALINSPDVMETEEFEKRKREVAQDIFERYKKDLINKYGSLDNVPLDEYAKLKKMDVMVNSPDVMETEEFEKRKREVAQDIFERYKKDLINKYGSLDNVPLDEYAKLRRSEALINSPDVMETEEFEKRMREAEQDIFERYKKDLINKYGSLDNVPLDEYAKLRRSGALINAPMIMEPDELTEIMHGAEQDIFDRYKKDLINKYGSLDNVPADEYAKLKKMDVMVNSPDVMETEEFEKRMREAEQDIFERYKKDLINKYGSLDNVPADKLREYKKKAAILNKEY